MKDLAEKLKLKIAQRFQEEEEEEKKKEKKYIKPEEEAVEVKEDDRSRKNKNNYDKTQRTTGGVLVDVSNMYHSAKNLYSKKTNFKEILNKAVAGRKLIRATAYAIRTENKEESPFVEALEQQGFEVKMKDLQIFAGGRKRPTGMSASPLTPLN